MIPVRQRISASGGDAVPGDCVKCCVASILELSYEDVPHFVAREVLDDDGEPMNWFDGVNVWLARRGYPLRLHRWSNNITGAEMKKLRADMGLKDGEPAPDNSWYRRSAYPDRHRGWWIASVISENYEDSTHAVVMFDDQVAFDPSTTPRRTPYEFIGGEIFVATDPARWRP